MWVCDPKTCLHNWQTTYKTLYVTIPNTHCPLFFPSPNTQLSTYRFPACVDLILAAVSPLAWATWKTKTKGQKQKKKDESHFKSVQINEPEHCLPPLSLAVSARSWLGSGLESTQAELIHCNWMLRAGGNCSHLPTLDVSADGGRFRRLSPSSDIVMRLWFGFPFFPPLSFPSTRMLSSNSDPLL